LLVFEKNSQLSAPRPLNGSAEQNLQKPKKLRAWKKYDEGGMELFAIHREAVRLREAADQAERYLHSNNLDTPGSIGEATRERLLCALSSTPVTQKEVERVRAMERVIEAVRIHYQRTGWVEQDSILDALADYERVVKEKP
jgi:hypothetical protein